MILQAFVQAFIIGVRWRINPRILVPFECKKYMEQCTESYTESDTFKRKYGDLLFWLNCCRDSKRDLLGVRLYYIVLAGNAVQAFTKCK
jgi:hypothetical protein